MNLQHRIELMVELGEYMLSQDASWLDTRERAERENGWFIRPFIQKALESLYSQFLRENKLKEWTSSYPGIQNSTNSREVGIVMAGNIPLVGFHDLLAVFLSGHIAVVKPSSKDKVLPEKLVQKLVEWEPQVSRFIRFQDMLKGCDAYIATGSNNSSRYFDYYFGKYPHIIRRNRTSVAILQGTESKESLEALADDIHLYFGLGCRNVTKIYVPRQYDFIPLIEAFKKYNWMADHHKYKNNYDYNLSLLILNNKPYMSSGSLLLVEDAGFFSPISTLHYEYYDHVDTLAGQLEQNSDLQCITGTGFTAFGQAQCPALTDYADGVDVMAFLAELRSS